MNDDPTDALFVDCRVVDSEGFKATVRYIGPVIGAKNQTDIWLGVEWDQPGRGKHDGSSVDEHGVVHRYFVCSQPNSGSFIRPSKVSLGRSLVAALNDRYVSVDAPSIVESETNTLADAFVSTSKGNLKSVVFIGEDKIRKRQQISNVTAVSIRNDTVSTVDHLQLAAIASHLLEIDLQDNLLWRWEEIAKLGVQVPALKSLLLQGNRLQPLTEHITKCLPSSAFASLRILALNSCGIKSWDSIQRLEPFLPCIEELYLANNKLVDLPRLIAQKEYEDATGVVTDQKVVVLGFSSLRLLDLSGCGLDEWSQVGAYGLLPGLRELVLDANPLTCVDPPSDGHFNALRRFSLTATSLASWHDVDVLATYPQLTTLRLSQVPLFAGKGSSEVRFEVIARMKTLTFFNGSPVQTRERVESEKNYLRCLQYERVSDSDQVDTKLHPRYAELMAKYGADMVPSSKAIVGPSNLAAELVNVTIRNLSFASNGSLEPITKKLPRSLTVGKLQLLVKQLFGLDPRLQHLSVRLFKDAPPTELDDDKASLAYYGVVEGSEIFINEGKA